MFTVNDLTRNECLIRYESVSANHKAKAKHIGTVNQIDGGKFKHFGMCKRATQSETKSGRETMHKLNKAGIEQTASILKSQPSSESKHEPGNHSKMNEENIEAANQPPIKVQICYSFNQIEFLQSLGNLTFASRNDSDEFMQKNLGRFRKPDTTKIRSTNPMEGKN